MATSGVSCHVSGVRECKLIMFSFILLFWSLRWGDVTWNRDAHRNYGWQLWKEGPKEGQILNESHVLSKCFYVPITSCLKCFSVMYYNDQCTSGSLVHWTGAKFILNVSWWKRILSEQQLRHNRYRSLLEKENSQNKDMVFAILHIYYGNKSVFIVDNG